MGSQQVIFILASASQGIRAEAALRAAGVTAALVPVPRALSSQCGVCLRVPVADKARAESILNETGTAISGVHEIDVEAPAATGPKKEAR